MLKGLALTLSKKQQDEMRTRRDAGRTRLESGLTVAKHPLPKETASQGSYQMRTMTQDDDNDYDIDDGVYFDDDDLIDGNGNALSPLAARDRVCDALKWDGRLKHEAEVKRNCVRQVYPAGYHIDVPVYRIVTDDDGEKEWYELASGDDWVESDARDVTRWFNDLVPAYIAVIEAALEMRRPGRWNRLEQNELDGLRLRAFCVGWRIILDADEVLIKGVDHLLVILDSSFPNSQPWVLAPQIERDCLWPHVESQGLLCLQPTRVTAPLDARVIQHLNWAIQLLNADADHRRVEFEREFVAYWNQRASTRTGRPQVLSLVRPRGRSRTIMSCADGSHGRIVLADTKAELQQWLRNSGVNPADREILPSWLVRLPRPWTPPSFPEYGREVIEQIPKEAWRQTLKLDTDSPVLFEAKTPTGPAFAAVLLSGPKARDMRDSETSPVCPSKTSPAHSVPDQSSG